MTFRADAVETRLSSDPAATADLRAATRDDPLSVPDWVLLQRVGALVVSVLQARLVHIRESRLDGFALPRDPAQVTLRQVAALHRGHHGTLGQGFEIAVCDAINDQVPGVVSPVQDALAGLGVREPVVRADLLALENVPVAQRPDVVDGLRDALADGSRLKTGTRGQPALIGTTLQRWAAGTLDASDPDADQTPRADVLISTESHWHVLASLKVNPWHVDWVGWRNVPLWIVGDARGALPPTRRPVQRFPVQVAGVGSRWMQRLRTAHDVVDTALAGIDGSHAPLSGMARPNQGALGRYGNLVRWLTRRAKETVQGVIDELRARVAVGALGEIADPAQVTVTVPVADLPANVEEALSMVQRPDGLYVPEHKILLPDRAA